MWHITNKAETFFCWKLKVFIISEGQLWLTGLINYAWWLVLICRAAFQVGESTDEREEKMRRRQEGRRWKLKPCSLIKTGVNFFSPSLQPKELFTMATGEHRGKSARGCLEIYTVLQKTSTATHWREATGRASLPLFQLCRPVMFTVSCSEPLRDEVYSHPQYSQLSVSCVTDKVCG